MKISAVFTLLLAAILLFTACNSASDPTTTNKGTLGSASATVLPQTTADTLELTTLTTENRPVTKPISTAPLTTNAPEDPVDPVTYPLWDGHTDIELLASPDPRLGEVIALSAANDRLLITYRMEEYVGLELYYTLVQELNLVTGVLSDAWQLPSSDCSAQLLESGNICVYDPLSYRVEVFDQNGEGVFSYQYRGEGSAWIDPSRGGTAWFYDWNDPTLTKVALDGSGEYRLDTPEGLVGYIAGQSGDLLCFTGWDDVESRSYALHSGATDNASLSPLLLNGVDGYSFGGNCFYRAGWADRNPRILSPADPDHFFEFPADSFDSVVTAAGDQLLCEQFAEEEGTSSYRVVDYRNGKAYPMLTPDEADYAQAFTFSDGSGLFFAVLESGEDGSAWSLCRWNYQHDSEAIPVQERELGAILRDVAAIAEEITQTYGITVIYGADLISRVASDYSTQAVDDPDVLAHHLGQLKEALRVYPAGFFDDLAYGEYTRLEIYLCDTFVPLTPEGITTAQALSNTRGSVLVIGFDVNLMEGVYPEILAHEIFHLMENRMNYVDFDLLEEWMTLTPGGYDAYYFSYHDENGQEMNDPSHTYGWESDPAEAYFADAYSKSYPTEDRARIFEYLVRSQGDPIFADSPVMMEKARTLCRLIRETFPSVAATLRAGWEVESAD